MPNMPTAPPDGRRHQPWRTAIEGKQSVVDDEEQARGRDQPDHHVLTDGGAQHEPVDRYACDAGGKRRGEHGQPEAAKPVHRVPGYHRANRIDGPMRHVEQPQ
nr:hypothetical protein [Aquamicrobium defluvii]